MNINKRTYTYPVLCEDDDAYKDSEFIVDAKHVEVNGDKGRIEFNITLKNTMLEYYISNGVAEYVIHVECSETSYRETIHKFNNHFSHDIMYADMKGKIDILGLVIAKQDIQNFSNPGWSDDYQGIEFSIPKGSILAYYNMPSLLVDHKLQEYVNNDSIFTISRLKDDNQSTMSVDLKSDKKIKIFLPDKEYRLLSRLYRSKRFSPILNSLLVMPVVVHVFEELKLEGGMDSYCNNEWYRRIAKRYSSKNINFEHYIASNNSLTLAQDLLKNPISVAFTALENLSEEEKN